MPDSLLIRAASEADAGALLEIYAPYVQKTAVTFEYEPPSAAEFAGRIRSTLAKYPWLVAEWDGEPLGYAYAGPFHSRPAYGWGAELSIYLRMDARRQGTGSALYRALEEVLRAQGVLNLNACIACPVREDEYLTFDSIRFHERQGYRMVGKFTRCGYKFGRWYDMVWMEKLIGAHTPTPAPVRAFPEVWEQFRLEDRGFLW